MDFITIPGLMVFAVFIVIYFLASQKQYNSRYLFLFCCCFFSMVALPGFSFIHYKKLNEFLVRYKLVTSKFGGKEYTFALIFLYILVWDKKKTPAPSWFESLLTMALLIIPLLLVVVSGSSIK